MRPGVMVDRPNRFVVRARLDPDETLVECHLPDPGRLEGLLQAGTRMWIRPASSPERRTRFTAAMAQAEGELVSLDTQLPNKLIHEALQRGALREFAGFELDRPEVPVGRSRFDFRLADPMGHQLFLEVKSVTWAEGKRAFFPDAPSERATRQVKLATQLSAEPATSAAVLFVCQRRDVESVEPARDLDPAFAEALAEAARGGVRLVARRCRVTLEELVLGQPIELRVSFPPRS